MPPLSLRHFFVFISFTLADAEAIFIINIFISVFAILIVEVSWLKLLFG